MAAVNVAAAANGGVATASSTVNSGYLPDFAINGDRTGAVWGTNGGWNDGTPSTFDDWIEVDFNASYSIGEIDVFGLQDSYPLPTTPTLAMASTLYGLSSFEIQTWNGAAWVTVTGGTITGNNKVWKQVTFTPVSTTKIRLLIHTSQDGLYSRVVEVEAWTAAVPLTPQSPSPPDGATGVSPIPTLSWLAPGATSYDVYFGTAGSPPLVSSGQTSPSYAPAMLAASTVYHWKIVTINASGSTTGAIWTFTTVSAFAGTPLRNTFFQQAFYQETPDSFWRLNDASISTVAGDQTLNSHDGTVVGGVTFWQAGWSGDGDTAALFDGTTGYLNVGNVAAFAYQTRFSVMVSFKTTDATHLMAMIGKSLSATKAGWAVLLDSGSVRFWAYTSAGVSVFDLSSPLTTYADGAWHQAILVYDPIVAKTVRLAIDGTVVATATPSGLPDGNAARLLMGALDNAGTPVNFFNGRLDEVALYGYALTTTQIAALNIARNKIANDKVLP